MRTLVTGASRGIGAALMDEGRARGHDMLGTVRTGTGLRLDVTDADMQADVAAQVGALDLVVCNAGVFPGRGKTLETLTADDLNATFAANVTGVFLTVQAQVRNLSDGGRIAIIASQMGSTTQATGDSFAYRASKAAAINLGMSLSDALRGRGIAVGIYHPGWVRTDMGGETAAVGVAQSAKGLWDRFEALDMIRSGAFETYDGTPHPL
ncbi:SDR family NAD(P)-dependent oxidoreductase [Jannaschia donghaensis]|uniref:C signal n=1 Tax=Jannaschia donghaensis TaxID=420998 RepID=A0A0M6YL48_9RHOB|nr:SDR family NAD(P)-dependent oxidoreductase [Jannaschia donghaensis]CTQ50385.1 C signal [Jannaschia donghaensis]